MGTQPTRLHRERPTAGRRGTATTEVVLIIPILLMWALVVPWVAQFFLELMMTRTEAHRDMLDKTTTFVVSPGTTQAQGSDTSPWGFTPSAREHSLAGFPQAVPTAFDALGTPSAQEVNVGGPFPAFELFAEGFSNAAVEGWETTEYSRIIELVGTRLGGKPAFLTAYGAVIRSPWTRLGWPWIPTQDMKFEPAAMKEWHEGATALDDDIRGRYNLAE